MVGFWSILAIVMILAIAIILMKASGKPDRFRIERSIEIKAPAAKIFPHINRMDGWKGWSPWQEKDPVMVQIFGQIAEGVGSSMTWEGNGKVGKGAMTIAESRPFTRVLIKLDFVKPMKANNEAEFTLREGNGTTVVIWAMTGPSPLISKVMDTLMNMDKLVGQDFERGLANLKRISEA